MDNFNLQTRKKSEMVQNVKLNFPSIAILQDLNKINAYVTEYI